MNPSAAPPVTHYENFPVASWLCPPALRPPIAAIYHYARTADDLADEGDVPADRRLEDLTAYRASLHAAARGDVASGRWASVFGPLAAAIARHHLPLALLDDLLLAFMQDVCASRDGTVPASDAALLDYCRRSANPVGRLLLHLYGVTDPVALARSDAICSALQLINFWQDLSVDLPRGRYYLPQDRCDALGVDPRSPQHSKNASILIAQSHQMALAMMQKGAPLVHQLSGRVGWELRLVVQGGLRVLEQVGALGEAVLHTRPVLRRRDAPRLLWRALWM